MSPIFQSLHIVFALLVTQCVHQLSTQTLIHYDDFGSQGLWVVEVDGPGADPADWAEHNRCTNDFASGPCLEINGGDIVARVIPTAGYQSIWLQFDVTESGLDTEDYCYAEYGIPSVSSSWITVQLIEADGLVKPYTLYVTDSATYNDQTSFTLKFGNTGDSGGDNCFFDNLYVYGTAVTSQPTSTSASATTTLSTTAALPSSSTLQSTVESADESNPHKDTVTKTSDVTVWIILGNVLLCLPILLISTCCCIFLTQERRKSANINGVKDGKLSIVVSERSTQKSSALDRIKSISSVSPVSCLRDEDKEHVMMESNSVEIAGDDAQTTHNIDERDEVEAIDVNDIEQYMQTACSDGNEQMQYHETLSEGEVELDHCGMND